MPTLVNRNIVIRMKSPRNTIEAPRGGWHFIDPVTQVPVTHSHNLAFLQKVREVRIANGIEMHGGWEHDVMDEVCRQNPQLDCLDTERPEIHMTADDVHRFLNTLGEMGGSDLVSEEEHVRRANICLGCPMMADVSCKFCGWAAKKITELLNGRPIHRVAELHKKGCRACGCNLDTKTYYPLDVLRRVDERQSEPPQYWDGCWMRENEKPAPTE